MRTLDRVLIDFLCFCSLLIRNSLIYICLNVIVEMAYYEVILFDLLLFRSYCLADLHALCTSCVELASCRRICR